MDKCQGMAKFDTRSQAIYVARQEQLASGGNWRVVECDNHYHIEEF